MVCGARVVNQNPKTVTCDPICTKAHHAGRTRQEQIEIEYAATAELEFLKKLLPKKRIHK